MIVRKLRLEKCWSQEHLAELSGLSVRTIQRIERGQKPSLDSLKALAAAFDVDAAELTMEDTMLCEAKMTAEEERAIMYVRDLKGFYSHLIVYCVVIAALVGFNLLRRPDHLWVVWPAVGWGIGVLMHGLNVFEVFSLFGAKWENRQIKKRLKNQ